MRAAADRAAVVTWALLCVNVAAFGWQLGAGLEVSAFRGGAIPYEILTLSDVDLPALAPPPLTLLTSMFLHAGFLHAASNLLVLWLFGPGVEGALGRARFGLFYLGTGLAAALVQTVAAAASGDVLVPIVGASGAIAGVLAATLALLPRAKVRLLGVRASPWIGLWLALQIVAVVFGGRPGVAFFSHLGGFAAGWLWVRAVGPRRTGAAGRASE